MSDCLEMLFPKIYFDILEISKYYCTLYSNKISINNKLQKKDIDIIVDKIYMHICEDGIYGTNFKIANRDISVNIEKSKYIVKLKKDFILSILLNEIIERRDLEQFVNLY